MTGGRSKEKEKEARLATDGGKGLKRGMKSTKSINV
jgi:hypothetical protein